MKTRPPAPNKKPKIAEKVEEPGDGAYYAPSANRRRGSGGGGARKGIDRTAGAKGGKKGIRGKGLKFDKTKGGKVVKFAGLDDEVFEGKENADAEAENGKGGKRQRVPTEKAMLAKQ